MAHDVRVIANAILDAAANRDFHLSNLSLNKILYFAHAWFLVKYRRPLIDSSFEAWQYGPVHPQIYRQLKHFGDGYISCRLTKIDISSGDDVDVAVSLDEQSSDMVERITAFYGRYSAAKLVDISHEAGAPWDQIWSAAEKAVHPGMVIPDSLTESFYRGKLRSPS